jgi:hypothetical protein
VIPSHSLLIIQIIMVNIKCTKICATDSVVLLHKGQRPQFGHPLFSNLSNVHNLFLRASQVRDFVFGGAQTFQTIKFMLVEIVPYMREPQSIGHWSQGTICL